MDGREQRRARLARRLEEVLGVEEAETLMAQLPPYDWPDLATKQDLAELRAALKGDMDQLRTELRSEISDVRSELRLEMAKHVRTHIIATVTAVAATGSLAFTAAGLM